MADKKEAPVDKKTSTVKAAAKAEKPKADKATEAKKPAAKAAKAVKPAVNASQSERGRLHAKYVSEIVPSLIAERGYKNVNEVPKLDKIILNMRIGDIKDNSKSVQQAQAELEAICGQKTILTLAKKSVSNFKLREGQAIGIKATLRGKRMYEFFDKLVSVALPRMRDFRGISPKSFDGRGNYAMGVKDYTIFPEVSFELVEKIRGFDVDIITTARTDDESKLLLTKLGMPFRNS